MGEVNVNPRYAVKATFQPDAFAWFDEEGDAYRFLKAAFPLTHGMYEVIEL